MYVEAFKLRDKRLKKRIQYRVGNKEFARAESRSFSFWKRAWAWLIISGILETILGITCFYFSVVNPNLVSDYHISVFGSASAIIIPIAVLVGTIFW